MISVWVLRFGRAVHGLLTEADNRTLSAFRIAAIVVTAHMCGLQFVDTVMNSHPFAAENFGLGVAAVWAAVGLGERAAQYPTGGGANDVAG